MGEIADYGLETTEIFLSKRALERPFLVATFVTMDFGAILRRERGKISREELAALTRDVDPKGEGISARSLYNWETGLRTPDLKDIELIAKALSKSMVAFITEEPRDFRAMGNPDNPPTREDIELAHKMILEYEKQEEISKRKLELMNRMLDAINKGAGSKGTAA